MGDLKIFNNDLYVIPNSFTPRDIGDILKRLNELCLLVI